MEENNHTRNIARLVIASEDNVLLAEFTGGKKTIYFLPGGGIEYNESIFDAAARELNEEIGIVVDDIEAVTPIAVHEHTWDDKGQPMHEISIVCKCSVKNLTHHNEVESKEGHLRFVWQKVSEIKSINFVPEDFTSHISAWVGQEKQTGEFFISSMPHAKL